MSDSADLVGYIVGERDDGAYLYCCGLHTPPEIAAQPHRQILREEAEEEGATCVECGDELAETEAIDG